MDIRDQRARVLVVDDNQLNRLVLTHLLEKEGYIISTANDGIEAIESITAAPPDLVLLDVLMPRMDGYQVLAKLKESGLLWNLPVIVISSLSEVENAIKCIELGAEDYLAKPFSAVLLRARIGNSLEKKRMRDQEKIYRKEIELYNQELEERVQQQVALISQGQLATIFALAKLAESRDTETGRHLERVREYCKALTIELRKREPYCSIIDDLYIENIYAASPLHDIGKVGIPDRILLKAEKLSHTEFDVMKTHSDIGSKTLRAVDLLYPGNGFIQMGIELAESHHENWDGSGYPLGRKGEEIPLSGRILRLADVYDATISRRPYKDPFTSEESKNNIIKESGKIFDPFLVNVFLDIEKEFIVIWNRFQDR